MVLTSRIPVVETVTSAFGTVIANLGAYARHVAPFLAFPAALSVLMDSSLLGLPTDAGDVPPAAIAPFVAAALLGTVAAAVAYVLAALVAIALTRELRAGRPAPSLGDTWAAVRGSVAPTLGGTALVLLAVLAVVLPIVALALGAAETAATATPLAGAAVLAILALSIGSLFVYYAVLRWFLFVPVLVVEPRGAVEALRRSWALTRGHVIALVLCGLLVALAYVPVAIAIGIVSLPLAAMGQSAAAAIAGDVVSFLASLVLQPVGAVLAYLVHETLTRPAAVPGASSAERPPDGPGPGGP